MIPFLEAAKNRRRNAERSAAGGRFLFVSSRSGRLGFGGLGVVALGRLGDQAAAEGLGADLDADDLAVDQGANLLDIRAELALGDAGHLGADAAEVLRLAAVRLLVAAAGLPAGEMTNPW